MASEDLEMRRDDEMDVDDEGELTSELLQPDLPSLADADSSAVFSLFLHILQIQMSRGKAEASISEGMQTFRPMEYGPRTLTG